MAACAKMELDVTFIGDSNDRSGNKHNVTLHGQAAVDVDGAHFDGDGDYIMVAMTPYSEDGSFTIAFWMTKTACTKAQAHAKSVKYRCERFTIARERAART